MILLSVGTQLPFDRLISIMDDLAPNIPEPVYGQIGFGKYVPRNFEFSSAIAPAEFEERFRGADVIVSHAGIGTILTAQRHEKPIILFPRRARYGEHRNDHQLATCRNLGGTPGIYVAYNEEELRKLIESKEGLQPASIGSSPERDQLIASLRQFLQLPS
jgi:Uncharacterized conserved protein